MRRLWKLTLGLSAIALLAGCASAPKPRLATPDQVNLKRYMGTWHVIAHIPNIFERGKLATADEYHLRKDGRIGVTFHYRSSFQDAPKTWHGTAWLIRNDDAARWKVQLLWPFTSDYVIMALDADYRYVMVGLPSRKLLWLMARDTQMPEAVYQRYVEQARAEGFPVDKLKRVPQHPDQVGQPGFEQ
ncbi:lipocalin family protein [Oleiagrimonas sp. C23AA]|uniref:lipocalin family protein n=1 Tax=Oleiagrimonas sp. C23AA TaxID=2719047 RepID=UPI00141F3F49|nr:lipocalin family protein [Oleiagrimonas sp. C23AA]NII10719.1 lipocalin family protein [Oleiagrimonas sp. C23AA]